MARRLALALAAALLLAACQGGGDDTARSRAPAPTGELAAARSAPAAVPEGVTVTGDGRVTGEPDTLRATVGVHVVRADVDEAFEDAATAADRVLDAIREQGVEDEDIQTRDFSVRPEREHRPEGPPRVTGYAVRNLVEVTIHDVDQAGELLAAVADAAGDDARVEGLRFSLEDNEDQLAAAREDAFDDARSKAEHYAELAGAELGELVSVTETSAQLPPPTPLPTDEAALAPDRARAPILPGEQEVGVQIRATWALQ